MPRPTCRPTTPASTPRTSSRRASVTSSGRTATRTSSTSSSSAATPRCRSSATPTRPTSRRSRGIVPPVGPGTPSEATIKSEYVLGQDEYGASTVLNLGGTRFPVPEQAVGRLVETAKEAKAALDADLVGTGAATTLKTVTPTTSLVTGYEFLTDSSNAVKNQLAARHGATPDSLINDTWTADQLRPKLLGSAEEGHRLPGRPFRRRCGLRGRHHDDGERHGADPRSREHDQHPRVQHGLPRGLQRRRRATGSPA